MATVEERTGGVIEAILKTDGLFNSLQIEKDRHEPENFIVYTVIKHMPCVFICGRGLKRGSAHNGPLLYGVNWNEINPDRDSDATPCCHGCSHNKTLCKPEWRVKPANYVDPEA